jgi:tetratricopeptide (TPR) repeat protein
MKKNNMIFSKLLMILILTSLAGCASSRRSAWEQDDQAIALGESDKNQLMNDAKKLWKTRNIQADLEQALEKFRKVALADPKNYEALTYLTRGYYLLADGILQDPQQKKANWEISVTWGEKGMATNPEFKKAVADEKKPLSEAVQLLNKNQIEALYWSAASLGKWAKMTGIVTTLQYKSQIIKMIETVEKLQPDFFYGAVHRYWGVYYAVAPSFAGGSMEKSLANFQKAFKMANLYLGTHLLYAENYLARKGDRENFQKELDFVLKAKTNVIPELEPEHILEMEKAKRILNNIDQYF